MADWDDFGITREEYEEAMDGLHDYLQESGYFDAPSEEDIAQMAADMGVSDYAADHVETSSEYGDRMKKEAALFKNMPFDQILQYRIDHKMVLTDADKHLINDKIVEEYEAMTEEHDDVMAYYDDKVDNADVRVAQYANDYDAQRKVAGAGNNVPAWMVNEYPIDEHGRAYTVEELRDIYEIRRRENTEAYEAARDKLFARVCDLHVMTTKSGSLPSEVTGGKSASPVITPQTFDVLGDDFKTYHVEQIQHQWHGGKMDGVNLTETQDIKDELPLTISGDLPVVDFSRSVTSKPVSVQKDEPSKDVQSEIQHVESSEKHNVSTDRDRSGASAFKGYNSVEDGRSNPDYDFDDYD